jgi:hypothetical protein
MLPHEIRFEVLIEVGRLDEPPFVCRSDNERACPVNVVPFISHTATYPSGCCQMMSAELSPSKSTVPTTHHSVSVQVPQRDLTRGLLPDDASVEEPFCEFERERRTLLAVLPAMLLNELQKRQRTIEAQAATIADLAGGCSESRRRTRVDNCPKRPPYAAAMASSQLSAIGSPPLARSYRIRGSAKRRTTSVEAVDKAPSLLSLTITSKSAELCSTTLVIALASNVRRFFVGIATVK